MRTYDLRPKIIASILIALACMLLSCSNKKGKAYNQDESIVGVKIYQHEGSFSQLFDTWNTLSINTAFVSDSLAADKEFRALAKQQRIKTFVICPIYYDPDPEFPAITNRGKMAVDEWVYFACPTRESYKKQKINWIRDFVDNHDPDGISIDFIRFFAYWEKIYPERTLASIPNTCFCDHCTKSFSLKTNIDIPVNLKSIPATADWIIENHESKWVDWKCDIITSMVKEIVHEVKTVKADILINLHTIPWRKDDFGQAIKKIIGQDHEALTAYVDFLSPMCYFHMVKQSPQWIHAVVKELSDISRSNILPSIQVERAYLEAHVKNDDFRMALEESLKPPSKGVVFWNWEALSDNPEKMKIIQIGVNK